MAKTRKTVRKAKPKAAGKKKKTARKPVAKRAAPKASRARSQRKTQPKTAIRKKAAPVKAPKPASVKAMVPAKLSAKAEAEAKAAAARKRPVVIGAAKRAKLSPAARKAQAAAEVRPLGVLPPSAMKRTKNNPVSHVTYQPRSIQTKTPPPAQGAERVSDQDIKMFEERLLTERQRILREMGHLENTVLKVNQRDSSGDLSGYSFHMADSGTDAMEREKAFLFASSEGRALLEVNDALRRLYRGEYGVCESCGSPIARARLEAMPQARMCVPCKEKEERTQRGAV